MIEKLEADLKAAMKAKDEMQKDVLRLVLTALKTERANKGADLTEDETLSVLRRGIKGRREAAEMYEKGGRPELADKERREITILEGYLPAQMEGAALRQAVQGIVEEVGAGDPREIGKVMKAFMQRYRGLADGKEVRAIAAEILGS